MRESDRGGPSLEPGEILLGLLEPREFALQKADSVGQEVSVDNVDRGFIACFVGNHGWPRSPRPTLVSSTAAARS